MKKFMMIVAVAVFAVAAVSCESDDEKVIAEGKLPAQAREFIETHFPGQTITRVTKDSDGSTEYDVRLDNGFKVEFNQAGEWRDVEGRGMEIPETLLAELPAGILNYITSNHDGAAISKVEIARSKYEVDLTNGVELVFEESGEFVRYDD